MPLIIPKNGTHAVSPDQLERIACDCGANEFEKPNMFAAFSDRLKPERLALQPINAYRCLQCFKYLKWDVAAKRWKTVQLHYDAPGEPKLLT